MREHTIVVGVDGSEGSRLALRWALQEADYRGCTVKAVSSWHQVVFDESQLQAGGPDMAREHARTVMDHELEGILTEWSTTPPPVSREVAEGRASDVLIRAAADAELLVLGSHGHSHFHHFTLGSVSEACIEHATCPVVVVPLPHQAHGRHHDRRTNADHMPR